MENEAPVWEIVLFLPLQRVSGLARGSRAGRSRQGCWLGQATPFPNLHSCVLQPALSTDNRVPVLTAALTPLCFFGVQICQGRRLREYIKAFFFFSICSSLRVLHIQRGIKRRRAFDIVWHISCKDHLVSSRYYHPAHDITPTVRTGGERRLGSLAQMPRKRCGGRQTQNKFGAFPFIFLQSRLTAHGGLRLRQSKCIHTPWM